VKPEISVIVPLFNEVDNVAPLARQVFAALSAESRPVELVLVDDASTDGTWDQIIAAHKVDPRVRGIRHLKNAGQSAALWTGFRGSDAPIIMTLDGDLQNDPADFPRLLAGLQDYDVVCGKRVNRQDNFLRKISSKIARSARAAMLGVDFQDTGCALRVFKRSALDGLFAFNGFHRFMPVLAHSAGCRVCEVPVSHRPRVAGVSKYGVWNRAWRGLYDLFAIAWYQKRRIPPIAVTSYPPETK
jgi:glycosyltransferase involved in cell wall biosynthesis